MFDVDYSVLPEPMRGGMRRYIEDGVIPGDFLCAVLENNLVEAYGRADRDNTAQMKKFADFLYNQAPKTAWGSKDRIRQWSEWGGMKGLYKKQSEGE